MAIDFLTTDDIAEQYLLHLKGLKPNVNTKQKDSDWWIRSRVVGATMAGVYADMKLLSDDAFPQSARKAAQEKHLDLYFGSGFKAATQSNGPVIVTGTSGTLVPALTEMIYDPNGNSYQTIADVTLTSTSGIVNVQSVGTGQSQNLLEGAILRLTSPPAGIDSSGTVGAGDLADGRDLETVDEAAARILARVQAPIAGGTVTDYKQWAIAAAPSVSDANVIRWINGPGTMGVVIIAGTTDIDTAVTNGDAIVKVPSDALVEVVQAYVDARKPATDCATVFKPSVITQDVTARVRLASGDLSTILPGQTLSQGDLIKREISRAIYKTPPGGRQFGATGFVVASEIEEVLDLGLSASPYDTGTFAQILLDRQIDNLAASGSNRMMLADEIVDPGVITVVLI